MQRSGSGACSRPSRWPALAAGKQNKFWQYTELFYREQGEEDTGYVTENYLQGLASTGHGAQHPPVEIRPQRLEPDQPGHQRPAAPARQIGVSGTPTLIFKGPKGQAVPSSAVPTYAQLQQAIKQVS